MQCIAFQRLGKRLQAPEEASARAEQFAPSELKRRALRRRVHIHEFHGMGLSHLLSAYWKATSLVIYIQGKKQMPQYTRQTWTNCQKKKSFTKQESPWNDVASPCKAPLEVTWHSNNLTRRLWKDVFQLISQPWVRGVHGSCWLHTCFRQTLIPVGRCTWQTQRINKPIIALGRETHGNKHHRRHHHQSSPEPTNDIESYIKVQLLPCNSINTILLPQSWTR